MDVATGRMCGRRAKQWTAKSLTIVNENPGMATTARSGINMH